MENHKGRGRRLAMVWMILASFDVSHGECG